MKLSEDVLYPKIQWIAAQTDLPLHSRRGMMNEVLRLWDGYWRVVGITDNALARYADNGFKYAARQGIERGHLHKRATYYNRLLEELPPQDDFFAFLREHDRTVLCVASAPYKEGGLVERGEIDWHPVPQGLFRSGYIRFDVKGAEIDFLRELHAKVFQ